MGNDVLKEQTN